MAYEEKARPEAKPHAVALEDRSHLSVTGVEDVERFDDDEIVMLTTKGALTVRGQDLHMDRMSLDVGEISVQGLVTGLDYEETVPDRSLWSRLFG